MWEIAEEFRALVVFAEHRYYGVSMPYGNRSFDDIGRVGYLTSQQALADYVDLITYLRHNGSYSDRDLYRAGDIYDTGVDGTPAPSSANPVIAFGGSYGGMLAAWFRIKYPAIVEGLVVIYLMVVVPTRLLAVVVLRLASADDRTLTIKYKIFKLVLTSCFIILKIYDLNTTLNYMFPGTHNLTFTVDIFVRCRSEVRVLVPIYELSSALKILISFTEKTFFYLFMLCILPSLLKKFQKYKNV